MNLLVFLAMVVSSPAIVPQSNEIYIELPETITYGTYTAIRDKIENARKTRHIDTVHIQMDSLGGDVNASLLLTTYFKDLFFQSIEVRGYVTIGCASACAMIFINLPSRTMADDAYLMLHGAHTECLGRPHGYGRLLHLYKSMSETTTVECGGTQRGKQAMYLKLINFQQVLTLIYQITLKKFFTEEEYRAMVTSGADYYYGKRNAIEAGLVDAD